MATKIECGMDYKYLAEFMCSLPSYVQVTMECYNLPDQELMARDFPREGRRFTNLTSGTEWFITPESLENVLVTKVHVQPFTIKTYS